MPTQHKVAAGEYLAKIARKYSLPDYNVIWGHARNAQIKRLRLSPNTLNPGDLLFIPDRAEKQEARGTTQVHNFQTPGMKVRLQLVLKDVDGAPIDPGKATLFLGKAVSVIPAAGGGLYQTEIAIDGEHDGLVTVANPALPYDIEMGIRVGHLPPVTELNGQKARLNNLGYRAGKLDTEPDDQFRSAVEEFQCDHKLSPIDGICGPATQERLRKEHGC